MASDSTRKYIMKAIERARAAEPYPREVLQSRHDDIFCRTGEPLDERRVTATWARIALEKYFREHPEDSIENYTDEPLD